MSLGRRRPPAPWTGRRPGSRPRGTWRRCRSSARRRRRTEREKEGKNTVSECSLHAYFHHNDLGGDDKVIMLRLMNPNSASDDNEDVSVCVHQ